MSEDYPLWRAMFPKGGHLLGSLIPPDKWGDVLDFIEVGKMPLFDTDLHRAAVNNLAAVVHLEADLEQVARYSRFLMDAAPDECWGSSETMREWTINGGLRGKQQWEHEEFKKLQDAPAEWIKRAVAAKHGNQGIFMEDLNPWHREAIYQMALPVPGVQRVSLPLGDEEPDLQNVRDIEEEIVAVASAWTGLKTDGD